MWELLYHLYQLSHMVNPLSREDVECMCITTRVHVHVCRHTIAPQQDSIQDSFVMDEACTCQKPWYEVGARGRAGGCQAIQEWSAKVENSFS